MTEQCTNQQQGGNCPFNNGSGADGYKRGIQWIDKVDNFIEGADKDMSELSQEIKHLQKSVNELNSNMKFWAGMLASVTIFVGLVAFIMNLIRFQGAGQ